MAKMNINPKYAIGQTVYLKTDVYQMPRMVTALRVEITAVSYFISQGPTPEIIAQEFEIRPDRDVVLATTGYSND